jgi:hypothetical protein
MVSIRRSDFQIDVIESADGAELLGELPCRDHMF